MESRAYESAKKYYPEFWDIERLVKLVEAEKMSESEYNDLTGFTYPDVQ